jgi:hypothetical protein
MILRGSGVTDDHEIVKRRVEAIFSILHRTPVLKSISFFFRSHCYVAERPSATTVAHHSLQWDIIDALACNPNLLPALRSLSMFGWLSTTKFNLFYDTKPFAKIISSLRHLCFHVERGDRLYRPFWEQLVVPHVLQPAVNLESLEKSGWEYLMTQQHLVLTKLATYPHLATLSLRNTIWLEGTTNREGIVTVPGVEDFIVRHRKTLKILRLRNCAIGVSSSQWKKPSCFWADIYNRLAEALTELVELDVEFRLYPCHKAHIPTPYLQVRSSLSNSNTDDKDGYVSLESNEVDGMEHDASALKEFKAVVEKRKMAQAATSFSYGQGDN